jgi:hypothetical protein
LREVGELRLTLDLDLTVAAAAMEDDRADVTADVIEHDRAELLEFAARADRHLQEAEAADDAAASTAIDVIPAPRNRRRRVMLSAGQVVLAAAACAVVFAGVIPGADTQSVQPAASTQLEASYAAFAHVAQSGHDPQRLVALGARINRSIEPLIAGATTDPVKARRMIRILLEEQRLLLQLHPAGSAHLLAQARALVARLAAVLGRAGLLVPGPASAPPDSTATTADQPAPAEEPTADTATAQPAPAPSASPTAEPTPQDTPSPEPSTSIPPGTEPTPSTPPFPFGGLGVSASTT